MPRSSGFKSRPPLERMLYIHREIQANSYPNAAILAMDLEVSTKSIHRDLEFMRDRLGLPLAFDRNKPGYYYTEPVSSFPTLQITEGEAVALVVAEKALQQYRGTSFEKPLVSAFAKMRESLPNEISVDLGELDRKISFRTRAEPILDLKVFDELAKATAGRQQIKIAYRKPGQREPEERIVDPYHLANINGEWFLFAFDHLRKAVRTFVPTRIKALARTGRVFARPQKFSLDERLRDSFGVFSGEGEYEVIIRFDRSVADFIREKKWHDSQQLRELRSGGLELRLKLSSLLEVERWVLSWAGKARVLSPPELANRVAAAARQILGQNS